MTAGPAPLCHERDREDRCDMKQIRFKTTGAMENAAWLIGGKLYQMVVNLLVSMLTARYLGPSHYGLIHYAASFVALFTSFCTLGINSVLVNGLLRKPGEQGKLLGSAIVLRLASSGLSLVTIIALTWVLNPREPLTVWVVAIYSTTLLFQCFDTLNCYYQSQLQSKIPASIGMVGYTVAGVYRIVLLVTRREVRWFAASHVVEFAIAAVFLVVSYCRRAERQQRLSFSPTAGRELLSQSHPFILSGLMVALYGQMDRVMLKQMLDEGAVGCYCAAAAVSTMWPFVLGALVDSAKPGILRAHHTDPGAYRRGLIRLYGAIFYISLVAGAGISLLAKRMIVLLYGEAYLPAVPCLRILCWETAFSYFGVARSIYLVPKGLQRYEKYIAATGAVSNLAMNAVLIPRFGIEGAAFATVLTQIITNFICGFFLKEIRENNRLILKSVCFWKYGWETAEFRRCG